MTAAGLQSGEVVEGRYKILDVLGKGGFATVYRARHLRLHSDVALKVLTREGHKDNSGGYHERFIREAQSAASIKHPNIVGMLDFGIIEERDLPYMVMELLEGRDLKEELRDEGPMEPQRAVRLLVGVLDALGDAHKKGIVHKDLKPSNLFLCDPGTFRERLVVTDFGIARVLNTEQNTSSGEFVGTPQYFAPEYLKNQIALPPLDVYQMGLILVEMMTGRMVVEHSDPMVCFFKHVSGELDIPQFVMDGPLKEVIQGALEFDYEARFQDGHGFKEALLQVDEGLLEGLEFSAKTVARPPADVSQTSGVLSAPHSGSFEAEGEREGLRVRAGSGSLTSGQSAAPVDASRGRGDVLGPPSGDSVSSRSDSAAQASAVEGGALESGARAPSSFIGVPSRFAFPLLAVLALSLAAVLIGEAVVEDGEPARQRVGSPAPKATSGASVNESSALRAIRAAVVQGGPEPSADDEESPAQAAGDEARRRSDAVEAGTGASDFAPCEFADDVKEGAESVAVDLRSEPPNASITFEGETLGVTPCRWRVARSEEALVVTMTAPGRRKGREVSVAVAQDGEVNVKLRTSRTRSKRSKRVKPVGDAAASGQGSGSRVGTMR